MKEARVQTAKNGEEAYKKASHDYYAVIISDIDMPIMDGLVFYKKMKQNYPEINKRFIFISGAVDHETMQYMNNENLVFIATPFKINDIRQAVNTILDRLAL